ncbi:MAG: carbohydrate ABC transporter permease [Anaerolineaceae bacterium]|nr:carbohydrate ABC transporter permease [Anaerolineaceae bacterium]
MKIQSQRDHILKLIFLTLLVLLTLFPIVWIIMTAFKGPDEINLIPPTFFPHRLIFDNFIDAIKSDFLKAILNSIIVGLTSTSIAMLISIPAGYAFARYKFAGSRTILMLILVIRMVPGISLIIPFFKMMAVLGLKDTYTALVLTYLSFQVPFATWLLESAFRNLPAQVEEAAFIDGCSRFKAFLIIMLPLAAPALATAAIFCFLMSWNEFLYAVTLSSTLLSKTGPVVISEGVTSYQIFWGRMAASATMYILPVILFNLFFQRYIVRGLTVGAVKG